MIPASVRATTSGKTCMAGGSATFGPSAAGIAIISAPPIATEHEHIWSRYTNIDVPRPAHITVPYKTHASRERKAKY